MKHKKKRAPGAYLKKRKVKKYQEGGEVRDVKDLLQFLGNYDTSQYVQVPGSEYINPLQQVVSLPAAEVVTEGTDTMVNTMLPEQIARTEGDLSSIYKNLGSEGVDKYLDMTQGVADAQNRAFENIRPFLYLTPMGTPAFLSEIAQHPERYNPQSPEGALNLAGALATFGRARAPQPVTIAERYAMQGLKDKVREKFRQIFPRKPEVMPDYRVPQGPPSRSGMFSAMEEAAVEAEILRGEEAVLGRQRKLPYERRGLLEEPGVIDQRNFDLGMEAGRQAAKQRGALKRLNQQSLPNAVPPYSPLPETSQQGHRAGVEDEILKRHRQVYYPSGFNNRTLEDVSFGLGTDNMPQIPALSMGGELEKRVNKSGMILGDQLDQFINKGGLSTFDKAVLEYARLRTPHQLDKKGRKVYGIDDLRRASAEFMQERFQPTSDNTVDSYQSYGFGSLGGGNKVPIGTKLILAEPTHPLGSQYIGKSSGHWTGVSPNVVGHYRGFTYGDQLSDSRTLYIAEMQSDVAQRGRFKNDPKKIPEGYPEDPLASEYDASIGAPRYTFTFPRGGYVYSSLRGPLPKGPAELFMRMKDSFTAAEYVPEGFDRYDHVRHVMEMNVDGVMTPENEYLYEVDFWEKLGQGLRDSNALIEDLNPKAYGQAVHFYNTITQQAQEYGMPNAERVNTGYVTIEDQQRAAARATDKIVEALEKNDTNPKGEFTDPYIQEEYDNALEEYSDALEAITHSQEAMEWIFSHQGYQELRPRMNQPLPDVSIQKAFVKNQDEFLMSQILLNEAHKYDVIRFPTGMTTAAIQGYTRSPARIQTEIDQTKDRLKSYEGRLDAVENLLDAGRDASSDLPALFIKNKDNQFVPTRLGQLYSESLSPELQELLFGAPLVNAQGQPIAHSSPDRLGTSKEIFSNIELYELNANSLSQKMNNQDVGFTLKDIEEGRITRAQQEAAHIHNFIRYVSQVERGNVARTESELLVHQIESVFNHIPNHTVSLDDPVNNPYQSVLVGKILQYDRQNGTNLKAQFDKYMEADGMSGLYARLYKQVDEYAYGENLMQPPELTTEQILSGSWKRQPVWEDAINAGAIDRYAFHTDMTASFFDYLKGTGYGRPYSFTEERIADTDFFINQFVDKYTSQSSGNVSNHQRINSLMEGVTNRRKPYKVNVGMGKDSYRYDYSSTFAPMPVHTSGEPFHPDFPPTRNLMTTDEVRALLSDFASKIESGFGGTARYRRLVSNPTGWSRMKNFVSGVINAQGEAILSSRKAAKDIAAKEAHLQSLQQQLEDALRGSNLSSGQQTVVDSYENLDKVAKKLGYKLKRVKDEVGNEWWELDVPASLKVKGGEVRGYKYGGKVKVKKKSPFKLIKK